MVPLGKSLITRTTPTTCPPPVIRVLIKYLIKHFFFLFTNKTFLYGSSIDDLLTTNNFETTCQPAVRVSVYCLLKYLLIFCFYGH